MHNFLDGWSTQLASVDSGNLGIGLLLGNLVHKAPESIVLGILLRAATQRAFRAVGLASFASLFLIIGGAAQNYSAALQITGLLMVSLAFAGAGFLFVGIHMFRAECVRSGRRAAAWSMATGFGAAVVLQQSMSFLATT